MSAIEDARTGSSAFRESRVDERYHALLQQVRIAAHQSLANDALAIGVTSTFRGEGVSTVAGNLAVAAAEQDAGAVLLVDGNAQHPAVGQRFSIHSEVGLRDVLRGDLDVGDCVAESSIPNLSFLLPGRSKSGEIMIFNDSAIKEVVDTLRRRFRWTVLDLPPADERSACLALAGSLDGVLLVVEAERVDGEAGRRICERLRRSEANILGVVYNKVSPSTSLP